MTDNSLSVNGIEVYEHDIYAIADEFIQQELGGESEKVKENFARMVIYIADRIRKPSHDDIALLDGIFQIYVRLCLKYGALPSIQLFSQLVKTNRATFGDWAREEYRSNSGAYSATVKAWRKTCKDFVIDRLHNSEKVNVNLIFIAKANYGLRETGDATTEEKDPSKPTMTAHEIHQARLERKAKPQIEFDEEGNIINIGEVLGLGDEPEKPDFD